MDRVVIDWIMNQAATEYSASLLLKNADVFTHQQLPSQYLTRTKLKNFVSKKKTCESNGSQEQEKAGSTVTDIKTAVVSYTYQLESLHHSNVDLDKTVIKKLLTKYEKDFIMSMTSQSTPKSHMNVNPWWDQECGRTKSERIDFKMTSFGIMFPGILLNVA